MLKILSLRGMSVLEVIIGASIILILTTAIGASWQSYIKISRVSNERNQAALILEEGAEIIQYLRDKSWSTNIAPLTNNTSYYLKWDGSNFVTTTTYTKINNAFIRIIVFSSVLRNAQDDISGSGNIDTNTRKVTVHVSSLESPPVISYQTEMLIHNIYDN